MADEKGMRNIRTAVAAYAAFNRRDWDSATSAVNEERACRTRSGYREQMERLVTMIPDLQATQLRAAAGGNVVMVWYIATGTNSVPIQGVQPTGRSFAMPVVDTLLFDEQGRIIYGETRPEVETLTAHLGAG